MSNVKCFKLSKQKLANYQVETDVVNTGELVCAFNLRGIFPALETLAVKAVVAQSGEDAINRLVHSLQAHSALGQLSQLHHWKTGSLRRRSRKERTEERRLMIRDKKSLLKNSGF